MDKKEPARAGLLVVVIRNTLATWVLGCTVAAVGAACRVQWRSGGGKEHREDGLQRARARDRVEGQGVRTLA